MGQKFAHIKPLTDKEEAQIQRQIASDPDNPELTDAELRVMKPFAEVFPDLAESIKRKRGRPPGEQPLQHVSLRLEPDVLERWKSTGPGWQRRINDALKTAVIPKAAKKTAAGSALTQGTVKGPHKRLRRNAKAATARKKSA